MEFQRVVNAIREKGWELIKIHKRGDKNSKIYKHLPEFDSEFVFKDYQLYNLGDFSFDRYEMHDFLNQTEKLEVEEDKLIIGDLIEITNAPQTIYNFFNYSENYLVYSTSEFNYFQEGKLMEILRLLNNTLSLEGRNIPKFFKQFKSVKTFELKEVFPYRSRNYFVAVRREDIEDDYHCISFLEEFNSVLKLLYKSSDIFRENLKLTDKEKEKWFKGQWKLENLDLEEKINSRNLNIPN